MNAEKNRIPEKAYYIGLDVGTNSVGWAVTDTEYNVLRFHGKHMWGSRLFPEAKTAVERRTQRTMRRRLQRRKQRLTILEALFAEAISKIDKQFFERLHESDLWQDDKKTGSRFSLFNDASYTDKDYHRNYATIYHLRRELAYSDEPHDVRLVFLAIHHLMKYRGHFLHQMESSDELPTVEKAWEALVRYLDEKYGLALVPANADKLLEAIKSDTLISVKKKAIKEAAGQIPAEEGQPNPDAIWELLAGAKTRLSKLFPDLEELAGEDGKTSVLLKDDLNENGDTLRDLLGEENADLLVALKDVFDAARLGSILGECHYISEVKANQHDRNHADLLALKRFVKAFCPELKHRLFNDRKDNLDNFPAYSRYKSQSGDYCCNQESFCKFLEKELPKEKAEAEIPDVWQKIKDRTFFPKLRGIENGLIPYQLQMRELKAILKNASAYLPFLNAADPDGYTVAEKILKTFEFRLPYYVGPLKQDNGQKKYANHWCVRFAGKEQAKIEPWNFDEVVDLERCAAAFMANLVGCCKYTGAPVLPKDSLLYSEYMLRNELNPLRVNGHFLTHELREQMIDELFIHSKRARTVSKRDIFNFLRRNGYSIQSKDEITGIDDKIKTVLKSRHDFARLLDRTGDYGLAEEMIHSILAFGDDRKLLRRRLKALAPDLDEADLRYFCQRNYTEWGNLSEYLLTGLKAEVDGKQKTVMDMLRKTNLVLMQILSQEYPFGTLAQAHLDETLGNKTSLSDKLDALYVSPAVERAIRQSLKIVDEIAGIRKAPPAKIFIEVARDVNGKNPKQRTSSRKEQLQALYNSCKEQGDALSRELEDRLAAETDESLRNDRLFLYYRQNGKDMYTGKPMELEDVLTGKLYDRDHIFPRSKIKDDSLDNLVLVNSRDNREKTNDYPLKEEIRARMLPEWTAMRKRGQISEKTYSRLIRVERLTEKELSDFVQRQLVETRQSTKALAEILKERYPKPATKLVYSKAQNVTEFRRFYNLTKCREVNDLHHAKDAYLNIVVGNVYDTRFTERFFANIRNEDYSVATDTLFSKLNTPGAWDVSASIGKVKDMLRRNDPIVTRMPREKQAGSITNKAGLQPAGKGQLPKKRAMGLTENESSDNLIAKYGGYTERTNAYFVLIEYKNRKKKARTLVPILVCEREQYEADPIHFLEKQFAEPHIICSKIHLNVQLEIDGKRLFITGRKKKDFEYKAAYQLVVSPQDERKIEAVERFLSMWKENKKNKNVVPEDNLYNLTCLLHGLVGDKKMIAEINSLPSIKRQSEIESVISQKLSELYYMLIEKCGRSPFDWFFATLAGKLQKATSLFEAQSVNEKIIAIDGILKILKAGRADLSKVGGTTDDGRNTMSLELSKNKSAFLIHQSATGLYEKRINLLTV